MNDELVRKIVDAVADTIILGPTLRREVDAAIRAVQRPTDEQIVMVIADTYQVSESTAYEWLATFGSKSEAA